MPFIVSAMTPFAATTRSPRRACGPSLVLALALGAGLLVGGCAGRDGAPSGTVPQRFYTVAAGDTVYAIARRTNVPVRAIIEENRLSPPFILKVGQVLRLPEQRQHVVAKGDTVFGIARQYGVDMNRLARRNALGSDFMIRVGQVLLIPGPDQAAPDQDTAVADARPIAPPPPPPSRTGSAGVATGGAVVSEALPPPSPSPSSSGDSVAQAGGADSPPPSSTGGGASSAWGSSPSPSSSSGSSSSSGAAVPPPVSAPSRPGSVAASETGAPSDAAPPPSDLAASPPVAPPATPPPTRGGGVLQWPLQGTILSGFGPTGDRMHNDGINIAASHGTVVRAAETGVVAYAGNEIRGFGNLLLIKHDGGLMTAYAHNSTLLVSRGQTVRRGQEIARVGASGGVARPQLHFEVRKNGKPVDPMPYLKGQKVASLDLSGVFALQ